MRKRHHVPVDPAVASLRSIKRRRLVRNLLIVLVPLTIGVVLSGMFAWYSWALRPLDKDEMNRVRIVISQGELSPDIARKLQDARIIRSAFAFELYARNSGNEDKLQAGTYAFAPSQSVGDIVGHLVSGKTDEFSITILPGWTMKNIRTMLKGHGYSDAEITAAFAASYPNASLTSRGAQSSLEGFFYPDTYNVLSNEKLQTVFGRIFDHFDEVGKANGLEAGFARNGLTLYQGLTLASIVQREVPTPGDQAKVASVFYNRLDSDIALGSDVTYIYGAELLGVEPTPDLVSPYNTRNTNNKGLTPTPIANPGLSALNAVANPAKTDYLFFLSGDDDVTYFARTDAEHEQNIKDHCKVKCAL